jgi:dihydrofolate reductase
MRNIVATEYVTLDGVMEAPETWTFQFWNDELFAADALLLGRVTYDGFAAAWPSQSDPEVAAELENGDSTLDSADLVRFADRMNGLPKYVVSTTLEKAEWNNSHVIKYNVVEELIKLKEQSGQDILLSGSADLLNSLIPHDVIGEYRFMNYPIVVGRGKRLFENGIDAMTLRLVDTKLTGTGVVILTYRPARSA